MSALKRSKRWAVSRKLAGMLLLLACSGCVGGKSLSRGLERLPACSEAVTITAQQLDAATRGNALWAVPTEAMKNTREYRVHKREQVAGMLSSISMYGRSRLLMDSETLTLSGHLYVSKASTLSSVFGAPGDLYYFEVLIDGERYLLAKSMLGLAETATCDLDWLDLRQ